MALTKVKNVIDITADTVSDLLSMQHKKGSVQLLGFHERGDGNGGVFYWDATQDKATHNGGTVIDPDVTFPTDWSNTTQQESWFTAPASGTGCWVREFSGAVNVKWFGAKGDWNFITNQGTDDTKALQQALLLGSLKQDFIGYSGISSSLYPEEGSKIEGLRLVPLQNGFTLIRVSHNNTILSGLKLKNPLNKTSSVLNNPSVSPDFYGITVSGSNCIVENSTVENFETGILLRNFNHPTLDSCINNVVRNCQVSGMYVNNLGWANDPLSLYTANNCTVENCTVTMFKDYDDFDLLYEPVSGCRGGIVVDIYSNECNVKNNQVGRGFTAAFHNELSEGTVVEGNTFHKASLCTVVSGGATIKNNSIECPYYTDNGVLNKALTLTSGAVIEKNKFTSDETSVSAIGLQSSPSNFTISNNVFNGTWVNIVHGTHRRAGVISGNITSINCTFNTFVGSGTVGLISDNNGGVCISGNTLKGTYATLYSGYPSYNLSITGNIANKCTDNAIRSSGQTTNITVVGNNLAGVSDKYAVYLPFSGGTYDRTAVIVGNNMLGRTNAVAAQFKNTSLQIVEANLNNTFLAV